MSSGHTLPNLIHPKINTSKLKQKNFIEGSKKAIDKDTVKEKQKAEEVESRNRKLFS